MVLASAVDFADFSVRADTNVRSEEDNDVSVSRAVGAECTPAGLSGERQASQSSKVENLTPSLGENGADVVLRVVMVHLIRARAVSKQSVICSKSMLFQARISFSLYHMSWHGTRELVMQHGFDLGRVLFVFALRE